MNHWGSSQTRKIKKDESELCGREFAGTGEGISQQPEKRGHFLWNERKASTDGYR